MRYKVVMKVHIHSYSWFPNSIDFSKLVHMWSVHTLSASSNTARDEAVGIGMYQKTFIKLYRCFTILTPQNIKNNSIRDIFGGTKNSDYSLH